MHKGTPRNVASAVHEVFLCVIFGCPAGARKWHIQIFAMCQHGKKDRRRRSFLFFCATALTFATNTPKFVDFFSQKVSTNREKVVK